jgi:Sec-independent protein translocase protein TatA
MSFLGIGPLELFFIILIAFIILGPSEMVKSARSLGKFLRRIVTSQEYGTVQRASREFKNLPNRLMREAGIEDIQKDLEKTIPTTQELNKQLGLDQVKKDMDQWQRDISPWTTPPDPLNQIKKPATPKPKIQSPPTLPAQANNPENEPSD